MQFIQSDDWQKGAHDLAKRLEDELSAGKHVLWLLSGGSNIQISISIIESIPDKLTERLTISLIDERYGDIGHKDSNFEQLLTQGFIPKSAELIPVLNGKSLEDTTEDYLRKLKTLFARHEVLIGQFGIGEDGHIAGILPESPALSVTNSLVAAYESDPYTRITMTPTAIGRLTAAYVFAFGKGKRQALQNLQQRSLNLRAEPALLLETLSEAYVYNDQIGGEQS